MKMARERALRRRAAEILPQLPEDSVDARKVLDYLRLFLDRFIDAQPESSGSSPNLRAISIVRKAAEPL